MLWLRECCDEPRAGEKARRLCRAQRRGLPVPDGIVLLPKDELDETALAARLSQLGERFAVRSSSIAEDGRGRSAAGLFLSRTDVSREQVVAAVATVRESGASLAVLAYCGTAVPVAVLIQPMVAAQRLGVLYLDATNGSAVCEERPADAPEWASVTPRILSEGDTSPLLDGARRLAALLDEETGSPGGAAYIEYALLPDGDVRFLQVRPAPKAAATTDWSTETDDFVYVHDQEHNPDPLSCAQRGLVEGVGDLVSTLEQRVFGGYLYYAQRSPVAKAETPTEEPDLEDLATRYTDDIAPACEALLRPLERLLEAQDGALDPSLRIDPSRCTLTLFDAWAAYRGVYRIYVAQLSPALRRARQRLDGLLRENLGESLTDPRHGHGALLAGAAQAPTERLQALFELGHTASESRPQTLRNYLARYGAFASSWDIAAPCDDERPDFIVETARRLATGPEPRQQRAAALSTAQTALEQLRRRLPEAAQKKIAQILEQARTAQGLAEEDDGLFFRAQRLCRWALLRRGALLVAAGRLPRIDAVFDLPWSLHIESADELSPQHFAAGQPLQELAEMGAAEREAARRHVPPLRIMNGRPLSAPLEDATVLRGHGVSGSAKGPVRGRARVVTSLFPAPSHLDLSPDAILVLPALLPSWAAELWQARALITDSGGALSHGAILARERGVPAVLGTRSATRVITDGQELLVDAERGRVYLLS